MLTIHDRIQSKMADLGLKQADLMRVTGAGRATISSWVNGPSMPRGEYLLKVANVLQTTPEWLLKGGSSTIPAIRQMVVTKEDHPHDFIWIDVVDIKFSCGDGVSIEYHYEDIRESLPFMPEFFTKKGVKPSNTKILVASGDSMENYIYDQDLFAIDTSDTEVKDGAIYAVYFENEAMLKQIFKEQGGTLVLHSMNPKYKDRDKHVHANNGDGFKVIGRQFWRSG